MGCQGYDVEKWHENFRKVLDAHVVNLAELAEWVGKDAQTIRRWSRGTGQPNVEELVKIAAYTGLTLEELCGGMAGVEKSREILLRWRSARRADRRKKKTGKG